MKSVLILTDMQVIRCTINFVMTFKCFIKICKNLDKKHQTVFLFLILNKYGEGVWISLTKKICCYTIKVHQHLGYTLKNIIIFFYKLIWILFDFPIFHCTIKFLNNCMKVVNLTERSFFEFLFEYTKTVHCAKPFWYTLGSPTCKQFLYIYHFYMYT